MAVRIQFRRGTSEQWSQANPTLFSGELGYEIDTKIIKFGDGTTPWLTLPVAAAGDVTAVKAGDGLTYGSGTTGFGTSGAGDSGTVILEIDPTKVISASAITAKGNLIAGTGPNAYTTVNVGTDGQALVANSSAAGGVSWVNITNPAITSGYISNEMLGANSVTEDKIKGSATVDADRSITTAKIRDGAITSTKLGTNAVLTAAISDGQIIETKLSGDGTTDSTRAVTTNKIRNLAVTNEKLANNAVNSSKVDATVYSRGTIGFNASSAKIHIGPVASPPTGQAGDVWFAY